MSCIEKLNPSRFSESFFFKAQVASTIVTAISTILLLGAVLAFLALKGAPLGPLNAIPNVLGRAGVLAWFYASLATFALSIFFVSLLGCRKKTETTSDKSSTQGISGDTSTTLTKTKRDVVQKISKNDSTPEKIEIEENDKEHLAVGEYMTESKEGKFFLYLSNNETREFSTEDKCKEALRLEYPDYLDARKVKEEFRSCPIPKLTPQKYAPFMFKVGNVEFYGVFYKKEEEGEILHHYSRGDFKGLQKWVGHHMKDLSLDIHWVEKYSSDLAIKKALKNLPQGIDENEARSLELSLNICPYSGKAYGFCFKLKGAHSVKFFLSSTERDEAMKEFSDRKELENAAKKICIDLCLNEILEKPKDYWTVEQRLKNNQEFFLFYGTEDKILWDHVTLTDKPEEDKKSLLKKYEGDIERNMNQIIENSLYYPPGLSRHLMARMEELKNINSSSFKGTYKSFTGIVPRVSVYYPDIYPAIVKTKEGLEYRAYKSEEERNIDLKSLPQSDA